MYIYIYIYIIHAIYIGAGAARGPRRVSADERAALQRRRRHHGECQIPAWCRIYYTILYYTILDCPILYCTILYYTVLYYTRCV